MITTYKINKIKAFLSDKKCEDITYYNVSKKNLIFEQCIIANCLNPKHLEAIGDEMYEFLSKNKINVHHLEGNGDSGWLIIDCYDLVINLFTNSEHKRIDMDDIFATNKKIKEDN